MTNWRECLRSTNLRALYPTAIVGELSPQLTGRELTEVSNSVVTLTPTEDSWHGAPRPHTLLSTATGRLIGIDLFDRNQIPSPLIHIIAAPRGGKSILMAQLACDVLASLRDASVNAIDIGETLLPLVTVLGGRYIRPQPDEVRAINIWAYLQLREGEMPDDVQKALVVGDLKMLARITDEDKTAEDWLNVSMPGSPQWTLFATCFWRTANGQFPATVVKSGLVWQVESTYGVKSGGTY